MKEMLMLILSGINLDFIASQAVGILTIFMSIASSQFRNLKWILTFEVIVNFLTAASYILLGAISGSYICLVATVQTIISYLYSRKQKNVPYILTGLFILLYIAISVYTYISPIDILPCICAISFALSVAQNQPKGYRIYMSINSLFWVIYDIAVSAYTMLLTHGILLVCLIIGMIRIDIRKRKHITEIY